MSEPTLPAAKNSSQLNDEMLSSLRTPTWSWYALALFLGAVVAWGLYAFGYMLTTDMSCTGLNRPVMWGVYIVNFVFWIGLSHSGTMVSAILRLSRANWRRPILRAAEAMTVFTVAVGGLFPLIHLGRNWVFFYLIPYPNQRGLWPNFRSALLWDATAIFTYIIGSSLFLYLGMLPDLAVARDRSSGWRFKLYSVLAMGWRGTAREWAIFHQASTLMAALIIPVAVSVHSIVAWDFAVTVIPGWHSTIFPPYFVIGAIHSGIAAVITLMIIIRRVFHLEDYLTPLHFDNMGKLLLVIALLWSYAYFVEVQTTWYAHEPIEWEVFSFMADKYAFLLLLMIFANSVLPIVALCFKRLRRSIGVMLVVSVLINVGMFIERFLIIVPSLSHKNMPFVWGTYRPTWVELSVTAGAFAGFALMYTLFAKCFPMVSVTDVRELEAQKSVVTLGRTRLQSIAEKE
ncbi:Polysulfide reductase NrfD [Geobacter metallireducens RCH3]|uniref:Menaquinol oxidoreductase complex ACIII, menaquinol-binding membrane protein subunit ActC n=1 Tax=Geobacter metallireducens (strain ATCC 53774 / DSM 7210 / GS-15) TaxID=269799 RepID=Q39UN3_GEOMG|nr:NrfD/PsrC family molybdoenzyme membrane anchor subunit [Geobacter metallireducens]ABB32041.1 menaquinol oxidoreductase complex ACIII, menaquinol-binding membrane protein subunit ActC [Geobacter metallireducens GS-15]EHP88772.1 Polysulfide reductase NrfD [Geobacter metallireducens RCH3]